MRWPEGKGWTLLKRGLPPLVFAVCALTVVFAGLSALFSTGLREEMAVSLGRAPVETMVLFSTHFFLNPWFYLVFAAVLALEHFVPAAEGQRPLSRGLRIDLLWAVPKLLFHASLLPLYVLFLQHLYNRYFDWMTIDAVQRWPFWVRLLLAVLVGDFLFWLTHLVRHKVGPLWHFHAVHHSQRELNFFTEYRVHPFDDVFANTIGFLPLLMVKEGFASVVAVIWIRHWHTRVCHSNIKSNFGWLRYLLVTPQSHRVHHSVEPRHHDRNFGLTFSVWDYLFGTQYRGYDEYPETGINEADFPHEQEGWRYAGLGTLWDQLVYPFKALVQTR